MARKRAHRPASGYLVLVVDDQEATLLSTKLVLEAEGHRVLIANSGREALALFAAHDVHLLLVDYFMPQMTGEELVAEVRKRDSEVQIVLQTGYSGEKPPLQMLGSLDIQGYHDKSEGPDKLLLWVGVALKSYEHLRRVREAERLKSQIVANISHEFRTPLNVILGYCDVLGDERLVAPEGAALLGSVRRSAEMLLHLVDGFLRLSDADAGSGSSTPVVIGADSVRRETRRWAEYFVGSKPIVLTVEIGDDVPAVLADEAKVRVVLMNLLSNAAKFTEAGAIGISAEGASTAVTIAIRDTGAGIAPEQQERIFEPFQQGGLGDDPYCEGTGIGLAVARRLARQMGGDIAVRSQLGAGATFLLTLPRAFPAAQLAAAGT